MVARIARYHPRILGFINTLWLQVSAFSSKSEDNNFKLVWSGSPLNDGFFGEILSSPVGRGEGHMIHTRSAKLSN